MAEWAVGTVAALNAALLFAALVVALADRAVAATPFRNDWRLRERVAMLAWVAPVALPLVWWLRVGPFDAVDATDLVVAHYLRGNLDLSASALSDALAWRTAILRAMTDPTGPVWTGLGAAALLAGTLRAAWVAVSALRLRRSLRAAGPFRRIGRLRLALAARCRVPFAALGPQGGCIVLPAGLPAPERRMILAHEAAHLRRGDPAFEMAAAILSPLFALNPGFWWLLSHARRLREHACDAAVLRRRGTDPRAYCLCLLDAARAAARAPALAPPLASRRSAGLRSLTGRRIVAMTTARRPAPIWLTLPMVAALAAVGLGGAWAVRAPEAWSHERLMLSSVTNLERLRAAGTFGTPPLR